MYQFPSMALAKCHRLDGFKDRHILPSGDGKSKIKARQGWFLFRAEGEDLF